MKVLGGNVSYSSMGINSSMDWVAKNTMMPAIASMPLGGSLSQAPSDALDSILGAGIIVAIASGNERLMHAHTCLARQP